MFALTITHAPTDTIVAHRFEDTADAAALAVARLDPKWTHAPFRVTVSVVEAEAVTVLGAVRV
jgi:hypothetical protein